MTLPIILGAAAVGWALGKAIQDEIGQQASSWFSQKPSQSPVTPGGWFGQKPSQPPAMPGEAAMVAQEARGAPAPTLPIQPPRASAATPTTAFVPPRQAPGTRTPQPPSPVGESPAGRDAIPASFQSQASPAPPQSVPPCLPGYMRHPTNPRGCIKERVFVIKPGEHPFEETPVQYAERVKHEAAFRKKSPTYPSSPPRQAPKPPPRSDPCPDPTYVRLPDGSCAPPTPTFEGWPCQPGQIRSHLPPYGCEDPLARTGLPGGIPLTPGPGVQPTALKGSAMAGFGGFPITGWTLDHFGRRRSR